MLMEELMQRLEKKIKQLVDQHDNLKQTNQALNQGTSSLAREKEALLIKQQKAILQIQTLVSRLKAMEKTP
jgi:uncharacterized protein (TIGR02449 family)